MKYILQAKTKEQIYHIADIMGIEQDELVHLDARVAFGKFKPFDSIQTDLPITFDTMAEIVDYLRSCNNTEK